MVENAEIVEVIRVVSSVGDGTSGDPVRLVVSYFAKDGELIARHDPIYEVQYRRLPQ